MIEINLAKILYKLIEDYGNIHGVKKFQVKKIGSKFVHTDINENLLKNITICTVGKTLSDLPINKDSEKRMISFYKRAWGGEKVVNYQVFLEHEITSVFSLEAILKDGKTDRLEGHCILINAKEFQAYLPSNITS